MYIYYGVEYQFTYTHIYKCIRAHTMNVTQQLVTVYSQLYNNCSCTEQLQETPEHDIIICYIASARHMLQQTSTHYALYQYHMLSKEQKWLHRWTDSGPNFPGIKCVTSLGLCVCLHASICTICMHVYICTMANARCIGVERRGTVCQTRVRVNTSTTYAPIDSTVLLIHTPV